MIRFLLDPVRATILIALLAVATPLAAWLAGRLRPEALGPAARQVLAAAGPFALLLWGFHNAVLHFVGFDSLFSALIVIAVAAAAGWFAGGRLRGA